MSFSRKQLKYDKPARVWHEALPLGNGSLGAMIFGGVEEERIDFNLDTLWSGDGKDKSNQTSFKDWESIRKGIRNKNYAEAETAIRQQILGDWTDSYLPLSTLSIKHRPLKEVKDYTRGLDLDQALFTESYTSESVHYKKEAFCSKPDQVFVLKLKASKPCMDLKIKMDTPLKEQSRVANHNHFILSGKAPAYVAPSYFQCETPIVYEEGRGLSFSVGMQVETTGKVKVDEEGLHIWEADQVILVVAACDSFEKEKGYDSIGDCRRILEKALTKGYENLQATHEEEYSKYFKAVVFKLGEEEIEDTTDTRLRNFSVHPHNDLSLVALMFNFGRYLLISSSRPGSQAANLQGIWNSEIRPPWSSNYTININTQMNYWLAETTNLSDCHKPLLELIKKLSHTGRDVAKKTYGLEGWVSHHNTDVWGHASPVGRYEQNGSSVSYAFWPMSSGWLCRHLWEHYVFNQDEKFLEEAYPIIEEAVRFYLGYLQMEEGYKVTIPSTSPENLFKDEKGNGYAAAIGSTMDLAILKELFTIYEKMCSVLKQEGVLLEEVKETSALLPPYLVGKHGQLQEWLEDFEETDPHHRHVSHLYGLYPGDQIDPIHTPELAKACEASLERRGDAGTGWSLAWKINLWARLKKGDRAFECIKKQLCLTEAEFVSAMGGGTYPNLLCAHPPFQIDGNFGFVSGITELLVQSHNDVIELLPALPREWETGSITGIKARGGFTVSLAWKDHKVTKVTLVSIKDTECTLIINQNQYLITCKKEEPTTLYF